jgi:hypothetical protein
MTPKATKKKLARGRRLAAAVRFRARVDRIVAKARKHAAKETK